MEGKIAIYCPNCKTRNNTVAPLIGFKSNSIINCGACKKSIAIPERYINKPGAILTIYRKQNKQSIPVKCIKIKEGDYYLSRSISREINNSKYSFIYCSEFESTDLFCNSAVISLRNSLNKRLIQNSIYNDGYLVSSMAFSSKGSAICEFSYKHLVIQITY
jgi:hypothetical protein